MDEFQKKADESSKRRRAMVKVQDGNFDSYQVLKIEDMGIGSSCLQLASRTDGTIWLARKLLLDKRESAKMNLFSWVVAGIN